MSGPRLRDYHFQLVPHDASQYPDAIVIRADEMKEGGSDEATVYELYRNGERIASFQRIWVVAWWITEQSRC